MSTYTTTWQCSKCGAVVPTQQREAGFIRGYGTPNSGPCPSGGSHEWHELVQGQWSKDKSDDD